jgi:hypothetical protein
LETWFRLYNGTDYSIRIPLTGRIAVFQKSVPTKFDNQSEIEYCRSRPDLLCECDASGAPVGDYRLRMQGFTAGSKSYYKLGQNSRRNDFGPAGLMVQPKKVAAPDLASFGKRPIMQDRPVAKPVDHGQAIATVADGDGKQETPGEPGKPIKSVRARRTKEGQCPKCGRQFSTSNELNEHMKVH